MEEHVSLAVVMDAVPLVQAAVEGVALEIVVVNVMVRVLAVVVLDVLEAVLVVPFL